MKIFIKTLGYTSLKKVMIFRNLWWISKFEGKDVRI